MSSREASWGEVFDVLLDARLRSVHTAMMGEIQAYTAGPPPTADVTLAVQLESADGVFETLPPLSGLPVLWPGAWTVGDKCLVVMCEESFAKWWATGSVEPPEVLRRHGLHGVVIPLVAPALSDVQFVALANLVDSQFSALKSALQSWTPVAGDGGAALHTVLSSLFSSWPSSVAAQKVKAV